MFFSEICYFNIRSISREILMRFFSSTIVHRAGRLIENLIKVWIKTQRCRRHRKVRILGVFWVTSKPLSQTPRYSIWVVERFSDPLKEQSGQITWVWVTSGQNYRRLLRISDTANPVLFSREYNRREIVSIYWKLIYVPMWKLDISSWTSKNTICDNWICHFGKQKMPHMKKNMPSGNI